MTLLVDDPVVEQDIRQLLVEQVNLLREIKISSESVKQVRLMGNNGCYINSNEAGELLVSDGPYDLAKFNELAVVATAYNFYGPLGRDQFVISGFLAYGDKQVGTSSNATVIIYEASQPDSITVDRILVQFEVGQNQSIPFPNIRILCNKGVYINAQTDDDDIHVTIFGHYVDLQGKGKTNG